MSRIPQTLMKGNLALVKAMIKSSKLLYMELTNLWKAPQGISVNASDLDHINSIVTGIESSISAQSIRDCYRLGRYNEQHRPRPILVNLNRATDVTTILSKCSALSKPLVIKRFMSQEERACEAILLRERWSLIQDGTDRKSIRIHKSRLFKNNQLHGEVINSRYQLSASNTSTHTDRDLSSDVINTSTSDSAEEDLTTVAESNGQTDWLGGPTPNRSTPTCKSLKILYYNARSILFKLDDLTAQAICFSPDIICIVETWLCPDIMDKELSIDNYYLVRLDRDRHGGGIAMYVKNHLSFSVIKLVPELEFCAVNLFYSNINVCIALSYRPPASASVEYFDCLGKVFFDLISI